MRAYKIFIAFAALFGLLAIAVGTIVAHGGEQQTQWLASFCEKCINLTTQETDRLNKGIQYAFYNLTGLLSVAVLASLHRNYKSVLLKFSGVFFILGVILFSGSLFATVFTENSNFTKLTPFGGGSLLLAWFFLFFFAITRKSQLKNDLK